MSELNRFADTDTGGVIDELAPPVIKLVLALVALLVLGAIVTNLPGLDATIPGTEVAVATLAEGLVALIAAAVIVNFGRELEPRIEALLAIPEGVSADFASIVKQIVFLIAVLVAYNGLESTLVPLLDPDPGAWAYDIAFLLLALVPLGVTAYLVFENLEEVSDLLTQQLKSTATGTVACPDCGADARGSEDFCPSCGARLSEREDAPETGGESTIGDGEGATRTDQPGEYREVEGEPSGDNARSSEPSEASENDETARCPACDTSVSTIASYCPDCGENLSPSGS